MKVALFGVIRPERALFETSYEIAIEDRKGRTGVLNVEIVKNQISVVANLDYEIDHFTLRNIVLNILNDTVSIAAFMQGGIYSVEINTLITEDSHERIFGVNQWVNGGFETVVDIDREESSGRLQDLMLGEDGVFIRRFLQDFSSALKFTLDTAFYCYRAVESLRLHCGARFDIKNKNEQWQKFHEICGTDASDTKRLRDAAVGSRHGEPEQLDAEQRATLLHTARHISAHYIMNLTP